MLRRGPICDVAAIVVHGGTGMNLQRVTLCVMQPPVLNGNMTPRPREICCWFAVDSCSPAPLYREYVLPSSLPPLSLSCVC